MTIPTIVTIGGFLLAIGTFFIGRHEGAKKAGESRGTMLTEIGYIKSGVDDIKRENREQGKTNMDVYTKLAKLEESVKQSHKRIDEHINDHV